jgi:hypothetical protein
MNSIFADKNAYNRREGKSRWAESQRATLTEMPIHSPELQARIDEYYDEWRKSRAKWNSPRGKWYGVILKLRRVDVYRYAPAVPLEDKDLISLRAVLRTSRATQMFHWTVQRDGDAAVIRRIGIWESALLMTPPLS